MLAVGMRSGEIAPTSPPTAGAVDSLRLNGKSSRAKVPRSNIMAPLTEDTPTLSYTECTEQKRLNDARELGISWKKWGPYLSERQWGTVREDYSADGNAWAYFSHDQSRSRAYRWGEDGL